MQQVVTKQRLLLLNSNPPQRPEGAKGQECPEICFKRENRKMFCKKIINPKPDLT
jgi:hypothetical protein